MADTSRVSKARERTKARFQSFLKPDAQKLNERQPTNEDKLSQGKSASVNGQEIDNDTQEATKDEEDDTVIRRRQRRKDKLKDLGKSIDNVAAAEETVDDQSVKDRKLRTRNKRRPRSRSDDELAGESLLDTQVDENAANNNEAYENSQPEETIQKIIDDVQKSSEDAEPSRYTDKTAERFVRALERKRKDDGLLLCINVHKCDQLKADVRISHPLVEVHLIDVTTGKYVKKSSKDRNVTSFYEDGHESVDYILPLMTQPCDFKKNKSLLPRWEEALTYNEIYSYFLQREPDDPEVIVMFEIMDFLSMPMTSQVRSQSNERGWYHIAWGFLKLVSNGGALNTDKKLRLQLYQPVTRFKQRTTIPDALQIFRWWQGGVHVPYPATLYVTVKGVRHPDAIDASNRSMFATQEETGTVNFSELDSALDPLSINQKKESKSDLIWSRLPNQPSSIPNKLSQILPAGQKGCTVVKFSGNGRSLACGCASLDSNPILVYEIPSGQLLGEFVGHVGVIYDLCWSPNGNELLSASSDGSVRSWDTRRYADNAIKVFLHPKYVYTARYHPRYPKIVVSGCYDHTIRIWSKANEGLHAEILHELQGHQGFVNCLCFTASGDTLYSGDSVGVVMAWSAPVEELKKNKRKVSKDVVSNWNLVSRIALKAIAGVEISCLRLHLDERKLLVQARDSVLRMVDLRSFGVMCSYIGAVNFQQHIRCTMSPCGTFVVSGSEDGIVLVWNTETGERLYSYTEYRFTNPVIDVDFHPHDNLLVMCCYGDGHPIHIYSYDSSKVPKKLAIERESNRDDVSTPVQAIEQQPRKGTSTERLLNDVKAASDSQRMQRMRETLSSVTDFITERHTSSPSALPQQSHVTFTAQLPREDPSITKADYTNFNSTWGSDFGPSLSRDDSVFDVIDNPVSPFASQRLGGSALFTTLQQQQQQERYLSMTKSRSQGNRLSSASVSALRDKSISHEEPSLPVATSSKKQLPRKQTYTQVISLYEYTAQREDELNFRPNEVITILRSENANWSYGRLQDGSEGFFPLNYVSSLDSTGRADENLVERNVKKEQHSVIIGKDGDLKILSAPEESDGSLVEILKSDRGKQGKGTRRKKLRDVQR